MSEILIFGAGNIGRAFIGQVSSRGGYEIVFVDIQEGMSPLGRTEFSLEKADTDRKIKRTRVHTR